MKLVNISSRQLFLIDGIGAVISAFFLGVILTRLVHLIGLPIHILYYLAIPACFFAVYSFSCYYFKPDNWRPYMKGISIANLIYCSLTITIVLLFNKELTNLGYAYFIVEILIVVFVSYVEWWVAKKPS